MIENEEQRQITEDWIRQFSTEIEELEFKIMHGEESWTMSVYLRGMRAQLDDLYGQLADYEQRKQHGVVVELADTQS